MGILKRNKKDIIKEVEHLLAEARDTSKVKCPKCCSTDVAQVRNWNESIGKHTHVEAWRGRRSVRYHCHYCGDYFDVEEPRLKSI